MAAGDVPRRRHWNDADKVQVVKESYLGHRQDTATARRHGISRSLLTTWRRQFRNGELGRETVPTFVLGNAPEFRVYVEAVSRTEAAALLAEAMAAVRGALARL